MNHLLPGLRKCMLFRNLSEEAIQQLILPRGTLRKFKKQTIIIKAQDYVDQFCVIIEGRIQISQLFADGVTSLMNILHPPNLLGADLICTESRRAPYYAAAASEVLAFSLPAELILTPGLLPEIDRLELCRQLLSYIANENMRKHYRLAILSQRSLRNRVLTYLTMQTARLGTNSFQIPFSREEMADFLCVNRSKLSHELSLMEQEGLIRFRKDHFTLLANGEHLSTWSVLE